MAKRELSSTLKNLKFMQRAARKEENSKKEEEVEPSGNFVSLNTQKIKCIVIMEGDPHPGAVKGRMSFQNFNPSINKLNEAAENFGQRHASDLSSGNPTERTFDRENGSPQMGLESLNIARPDSDSDGDHKRKQQENETDGKCPNESQKNSRGESDQQSLMKKSKGPYKQQKFEKLDWSVLRPPKAQKRKG